MNADNDEFLDDELTGEWTAAGAAAGKAVAEATDEVRDSVGNLLGDGDSATLMMDLKVKGAGQVLTRGTVIRPIRLTGDAQEIDDRHDTIKGLALRAAVRQEEPISRARPRGINRRLRGLSCKGALARDPTGRFTCSVV